MPDLPPTTIFEHRSFVPVSVERAWALYQRPDILDQLTPPPIFVRVLRDARTSIREGELEFDLWFGPFPLRWHTLHQPGPTPTSFVDRMLSGPLRVWVHEHLVEPTDGGSLLIDRIMIGHQRSGFWGLFTRLFFAGLPLRMLFVFRHWRSRQLLMGESLMPGWVIFGGLAALAGLLALFRQWRNR